jgi:hypothetical protein
VAASDLKTAIEAVGDKDVLAAPAGAKEDWQQALYEEFLRWRFKQVLEEKARTIRREVDTAEKYTCAISSIENARALAIAKRKMSVIDCIQARNRGQPDTFL